MGSFLEHRHVMHAEFAKEYPFANSVDFAKEPEHEFRDYVGEKGVIVEFFYLK